MEPVQDRGWHPRAELRVAIERVTDEVQGTHLLAYHLLVVEELQQVKVCDSHTKLVWEDGQSAHVLAPPPTISGRRQHNGSSGPGRRFSNSTCGWVPHRQMPAVGITPQKSLGHDDDVRPHTSF